jgi:aspartyl protease family protein
MFFSWVLIFLAAFVAFTLKDDFFDLGKRVVAEARGEPIAVVDAEPCVSANRWTAIIGRWQPEWRKSEVPDRSGATVTSISTSTAKRAGIDTDNGLIAVVQTANGTAVVKRGRAESLVVGRLNAAMSPSTCLTALETQRAGDEFLSSLSAGGSRALAGPETMTHFT